MRRILVDLILIVAPICTLSVLFFLGEQPRYGIACAVLALLALWYVRPRATDADADDSSEGWEAPPQTSQPGASDVR